MSTPEESINTNFCLQWSKEAPTLYKDRIFFFKNQPRNQKKWYITKCRACMCAQPNNLPVILKPTTNIWQKKSNKTEFGSFELNLKNWW